MKSLPLPEKGWTLIEVDESSLSDWTLFERAANWRNSNLRWFVSSEPVTPLSTREYLKQVVRAPDRILFWLRSPQGDLVGHFGLKALDSSTPELDNFIIGERVVYKRAALDSEIALLDFCWEQTAATKVRAEVHAGNFFAIKNHLFLGFKIIDRYFDATQRPFVCLELELPRNEL